MANVLIWKRYTPQWGNHDDDGTTLPDKQRWSILIKARPTVAESRRLLEVLPLLSQMAESEDSMKAADMMDTIKDVVSSLVRSPHNLFMDNGGESLVGITDVETLFNEYADSELVNELLMALWQEKVRIRGNEFGHPSGGDTGTQTSETATDASSEPEPTGAQGSTPSSEKK